MEDILGIDIEGNPLYFDEAEAYIREHHPELFNDTE